MKALLLSTRLFTFIFFCLISFESLADVNAVEATIDRNPVMVDEAIRLTITAEGSADRDAFDSASLLKDFVVGRTSISSQTSIVNFDTKKTTTWTTTLFPRKEGTFTIPAFSIEGKRTSPIQVKVIPIQQSGNVARDYFVTTDIDVTESYLNQQLLYTVKLFLSSNIERGSLQAPEMPNAEIKQLGEDKQYTDIVNGRRYQIIERDFAVIPQASGEFTLRGPIFSGEVMAANTNQRFGFFNRTQQINRVGPDITITVKPIPQDIDYPWLPSEMVRIDEEWPQDERFVVGEPVTRIITLTALGVVEQQLPEIPEFYPPDFKLYPDQSTTTTVERDGNLIAQRQTSIAIIPTTVGKTVLPDITVPWFNTLTGKTEYATIPARSITVVPNSTQNAQALPPTNNTVPVEQNDEGAETPPQLAVGGESPSTLAEIHALWRIIYALSALSILLMLALLVMYVVMRKRQVLVTRKQSTAVTDTRGSSSKKEKSAFDNVMKAIKAKQPEAISHAMQAWMATISDEQKVQYTPSDYDVTAGIQTPFNKLQQLRFAEHKAPRADLDEVLQSLNDAIKDARLLWQQNKAKKPNRLSTLYPAS